MGVSASEASADGYGYGSGSGYGDGSNQDYLKAVLDAAGGGRGPALREAGAVLAFWRSDKDGRPVNNGSGGEPRKAGMVEEVKGPLELCTARALHGTLNPSKWKGERLWVVALHAPVEFSESDGGKYGSLKREILSEVPNFFA